MGQRAVLFLPFALAAVMAVLPASADEPTLHLQLPLDCGSEGCFVQNYVDRAEGPAARDYNCGALTYNGHKGTDIGLRHGRPLDSGTPVLAPAAGLVLRGRDGMADGVYNRSNPQAVRGRECGNGVVIAHGDGWETQICHMRQGSIIVRPGDAVAAGERIGDIGMSGETEFPHVHVQVLRNGTIVDPFAGLPASAPCGTAGTPLWQPEALAALPYRPIELLRAGVSAIRPTRAGAAEGRFDEHAAASSAERLYFWAEIKGLQAKQRLRLTLFAPDGRRIATRATPPMDRHKARFFVFVASRRKAATWPAGRYRGEIEVLEPAAGGKWSTVLKDSHTLAIR